MNATDLHDILKPVMGKGILPQWFEWGDHSITVEACVLIAEAAMVRWLSRVGKSVIIAYPEHDLPWHRIHTGQELGRGASLTAALVAACVAVLEETK